MTETFGRYRLLDRIGQGGMAEVFKAKSYGVEGFEKVVVIKRILPELAASPDFVAMFIHEAKLAVRLSHANVVQVFDLGMAVRDAIQGEPHDAYYMAMEFVHGYDLATLLTGTRRRQERLPIELAAFVAAEVAKGLDHAHRRRDEDGYPLNIVHRDVSPQNVLVSFEGEVKVTDFGIAKARGLLEPGELHDTRARRLEGKFGYMSPEQASGENVDARSDIFSLGTVLYECLAGVNPFSAPTTFETLRRVQSCEMPPIELLRPDVPAELASVVRTAMGRDADDRYADASRMYEELLAFLYTKGRRFGAHDLALHLERVRDHETGAELESGDDGAPAASPTSIVTSRASIPAIQVEQGRVTLDVDRAVEKGERREVTALCIELAAHETKEERARVLSAVDRYGGTLVADEPSSVVALFGIRDPDGRDTELAARAVLHVMRTSEEGRAPSAGIHIGRVELAASDAVVEDGAFATLVDTARQLSRVRAGACALSPAARSTVRGQFVIETVDLPASSVSARTATGFVLVKARGPGDTFGRFVGRHKELVSVGELLALTTKRVTTVLTIRGDHGCGKTRLLVEVERRLRTGPHNVAWYQATCPPQGAHLPLSGIQEMLATLCGITAGDTMARAKSEVVPRLRALGLLDEEVAAVLSVLGIEATGPTGSARALVEVAFAKMVASLCKDRPHGLAWDAAHSMDAESLAILQGVLHRLPKTRAIFVFATRAGFSNPLQGAGKAATLDLADLPPDDVELLAAVRLGVRRVPPELVRFLRARAGGNPLFVEELIKSLVESRAVTVAAGAVVSMQLVGQDLAIPKTLRGLVAARVSKLTPEARATLQAAAVLGEGARVSALALMTGRDVEALAPHLAELDEQRILHCQGDDLAFSTPIVPEVVADALTVEAAYEMHAAAAQALERSWGDHASEHAGEIAVHYYEAGDRDRAATWFAASAERRLEARQLEAAARDYARALELASLDERGADEVLRWLSGLATAVRLVRATPEAEGMCARVIDRVDHSGVLADRVRARIEAGRILGSLHHFDAAAARFADAERIAGEDGALLQMALAASAELAGRQGDFTRSRALLERLSTMAHDVGDAHDEHKISLGLTQAHAAMGEIAPALSYFAKAEALLPRDSAAECERRKVRALVYYFAEDFRAAAVECERAIERARALGLPYEIAVNLHNLGEVLVRLDDFPRAYGALKQSLALCDEQGYERLGSHNRMFLSFLDGMAGADDAEAQILRGIEYASAHLFTWDEIGGRALLAQLHERRGMQSEAISELRSLHQLALRAGNRLVANVCQRSLERLGSAPPS